MARRRRRSAAAPNRGNSTPTSRHSTANLHSILYHTLPFFRNATSLQQRPEWLTYLEGVYGASTVASLQFPLDLKSFNFFYQDERFPLAVGVVPWLGRRPSAPHTAPTLSETLVKVGGGQAKWLGLPGRRIHDAYRLYHSPPYPADAASATLWLYGHAATSSTQPTNFSSPTTEPGVLPESGFPSFSRVEVMHCAEAANAVSWQLPLTLYHAALETCMKPDPYSIYRSIVPAVRRIHETFGCIWQRGAESSSTSGRPSSFATDVSYGAPGECLCRRCPSGSFRGAGAGRMTGFPTRVPMLQARTQRLLRHLQVSCPAAAQASSA